MDPEYIFREVPSEVWAIEYTNIHGDRVVDVLGTEYAAREAAEHYAVAAPPPPQPCCAHAPTSSQ
jgi:hypothetical protein